MLFYVTFMVNDLVRWPIGRIVNVFRDQGILILWLSLFYNLAK